MCTAFPHSEYYASSDFSLYYASRHPRYYTCLPVLHPGGTRDLPRLHICLMVLRHALRPRKCPSVHAHVGRSDIAGRFHETVSHYTNPITGLNSFTLAGCGSAPPLITLDPCCRLHRPKPRYECGGSPLTRRDSNPLSNVHLVAHRIFASVFEQVKFL